MERSPDAPRRGSSSDLGHAQSSNPPDDPEMIEADADPLDTDVEDADLFLGDEEVDDEELAAEDDFDDDDLP